MAPRAASPWPQRAPQYSTSHILVRGGEGAGRGGEGGDDEPEGMLTKRMTEGRKCGGVRPLGCMRCEVNAGAAP
ncbi:hypothetical protein E2C01_044638 [Portunus trituberculatus]|uniref:Uncharacterized protein n=1 Tax=Portunus trituberculatus TaxID=210409 RepID=A0A5B7G2V6_PORTR|nr:hypothetical protein [Portunus trituberculatus]